MGERLILLIACLHRSVHFIVCLFLLALQCCHAVYVVQSVRLYKYSAPLDRSLTAIVDGGRGHVLVDVCYN